MGYFLDKRGYRLLSKVLSCVLTVAFLYNQFVFSLYADPLPGGSGSTEEPVLPLAELPVEEIIYSPVDQLEGPELNFAPIIEPIRIDPLAFEQYSSPELQLAPVYVPEPSISVRVDPVQIPEIAQINTDPIRIKPLINVEPIYVPPIKVEPINPLYLQYKVTAPKIYEILFGFRHSETSFTPPAEPIIDLDEDGLNDLNEDSSNVVLDSYKETIASIFEEPVADNILVSDITEDDRGYILDVTVDSEDHRILLGEDGSFKYFVNDSGSAKTTTIETEEYGVTSTKHYFYFSYMGEVMSLKSVSYGGINYSETKNYDIKGRLVYHQDKYSNVTNYSYDTEGNIIKLEKVGESVEYWEYGYDDGLISNVTYLDNEGNVIITDYFDYELGLINSINTAEGSYENNAIEVDIATLVEGNTTSSYVTFGSSIYQMSHTIYIDGYGNEIDYCIVRKYSNDGLLLSESERVTEEELLDSTLVLSKSINYRYDEHGDLLSMLDSGNKGLVYKYTRDSQYRVNELLELDTLTGELTKTCYDTKGRVTNYYEGKGFYNASTKEIEVTNLSTTPTESNFYYTIMGDTYHESTYRSTDSEGNTINYSESWNYNSRGQLTYYKDRYRNVTIYSFDSAGNKILERQTYYQTDKNEEIVISYIFEDKELVKVTTETVYLDRARTIKESEIETKEIEQYSSAGKLLSRTVQFKDLLSDADEILTETLEEYDNDGNTLLKVLRENGEETEKTEYTYDEDGDILSEIYADGNGYYYEYEKNADDTITKLTELEVESGILTITEYDEQGRVLTVKEGTAHNDESSGIVTDVLDEYFKIKNTYHKNTENLENIIKIQPHLDPKGETIVSIENDGDISKTTTVVYDELGDIIYECVDDSGVVYIFTQEKH